MHINIIVDNLCQQLDIDEIRVILDIVIDDLYDNLIAEDVDLIDLDIVLDNLEEHFVVDEYLLVLLYEVYQDVCDDVHINILCGIFEVILIEDLFQQLVVEDGGIMLIQIVDDDFVQYIYIEDLRIILLNVCRDNLE